MKKTLIIIGIILALIILAVWGYLLFYGRPANVGEVFANFGLDSGEGEEIKTPAIVPASESTVDVGGSDTMANKDKLAQVTTRPVAGAAFILNKLRYVEKGTGHVYDIDLDSGVETIVSGKTVTHTVEAVFSPSGNTIAITTETETGGEIIVGSISDEGFIGKSLPEGVHQTGFDSDTLLYLLPEISGSTAYSLDSATGKSKRLFSIPLKEVRVLWTDPYTIYTTPTSQMPGYLYRIMKSGDLEYVVGGKQGLMATAYMGGLAVSNTTSGGVTTDTIGFGEVENLPIDIVPEKCVSSQRPGVLYCGYSLDGFSTAHPDDWYKGVVSYNDQLWEIVLGSSAFTMLADPVSDVGREIDIHAIGLSSDETMLWFINKNDDSLWVYRIEK